MEEILIANLTLDTYYRNRTQPLIIPTGDYGARVIRVHITTQNNPVKVDVASAVSIVATRNSDGESQAFSGRADDDGSVIVPVVQWMLEDPQSDVECHVVVTGNGYQYSTNSFLIQPQDKANPTEISEDDPRKDVISEVIANENARSIAESERIQSENERKNSEDNRKSAELDRIISENDRKDSEIQRKSNESTRISSEAQRSQAESDRLIAESDRKTAESDREIAEIDRINAEKDRKESENERKEAENNRVAAWANAAGIRQIVIEDIDNSKKYGYQIKIEGGKPKLYIDEI